MQIPTYSENGGNGNGHKKPFELAPVKTPEQIQAETVRRIAPEVRATVHFARLPAAAKFFFDALLDLTFMHKFGGSGRGKIFISIRDLSQLLQHDKDSIATWRDTLIEHHHVWFREGWPESEWRICAICPPPQTEFQFNERRFIKGKAAALEEVEPGGNLPHTPFFAQNGDSPPISEGFRQSEGKEPVPLAETFRQTDRNLPPDCPTPSARNGGRIPPDCPKPSAGVGEGTPLHCPTPSARRAEGFRHTKETPVGTGGSGAQECVREPGSGSPSTHTVLEFEPLDWKVLARLRPGLAVKMIERAQKFIRDVQESRKPEPNAEEVIAVCKRRIKEIRDWEAGAKRWG
jgi:hypothetical protein